MADPFYTVQILEKNQSVFYFEPFSKDLKFK